MIRSVTAIRERVLARTLDVLEHLRLQISLLPVSEPDVLRVLEKPQVLDLAVVLTNVVMAKFGHVTAPSESRFDKTRRAMNKQVSKGLRGEPRPRSALSSTRRPMWPCCVVGARRPERLPHRHCMTKRSASSSGLVNCSTCATRPLSTSCTSLPTK